MNQTIRRGDYLEVDPVEKDHNSEITKKKAADESNPNIYTESISMADIMQRLQVPLKAPNRDSYNISNLRDQLIQIQTQIKERPDQGAGIVQEIDRMFTELVNLETVDKVNVELKPFPASTEVMDKFPPPKDYKLMLPFNTDLEKRVKTLENIEHPSLVLSELLASILLGEKQVVPEGGRATDRNTDNSVIAKNQELISLSQRFQKLEPVISDFPSLTDRINQSQSLHSNAMTFIHQLKATTDSHHQIQEQLGDNIVLVGKLRQNWKQNKEVFSHTLVILKERLSKLRKK